MGIFLLYWCITVFWKRTPAIFIYLRTTLKLGDENTNILASGGIRGEIRMFHPASKVFGRVYHPA